MKFIDNISAQLTDMFGPFGPLLAIGILGLFLILLTLPIMLRKRVDPLDKLRKQNARGESGKTQLRQKESKLDKYSQYLEPSDEEEYSAAQLRLLQAGYSSNTAVQTYHFFQFLLGAGGFIGGAILSLTVFTSDEQTMVDVLTAALLSGVVGYMIPKYWVTRRKAAREEEIINGFPDSLDMMLVCVEAGQSLDQSILRVGKEIRSGYPALANEYDLVSYELKAGKERTHVLRDMSERVAVTDVSSFVTVLIQSATFGTSVAEALRVFSAEMRDKRVMRAEEKANKLPTKMTLATMIFTVPPLILMLVGPSLHNIAVVMGGGKGF